jgi:ABC-2 type transport system ATP-binding protein
MTGRPDGPPIGGATPPSADAAIATRGLTKHFGRRKAVEGLTVSVPRGTICGFVGPNGSGKSTTIRMLLGLLRPTAGSATVLGEGISRPSAYLPRVGAVTETPTAYPSLSARKNLEVLAQLGGHPSSRIDRVLEIVGLEGRAKDPVGGYSLGMRQRLGLAMALLPDPELLILDEPTNGLDPLGIIELREQLRGMRDQGTTLFISSHLLGELERVSDWLVMIREGRAVFNGAARDLVARGSDVTVEAPEAAQLELVARIATAAGYRVTRADQALRIACPAGWAAELERRAADAGARGVVVRAREASLEESFLAVLRGER